MTTRQHAMRLMWKAVYFTVASSQRGAAFFVNAIEHGLAARNETFTDRLRRAARCQPQTCGQCAMLHLVGPPLVAVDGKDNN